MTTTSGYSNLDGTCVISGSNCTSYTSNNTAAGNATVTNLPAESGWLLHFKVEFANLPGHYNIKANSDGAGGYSGKANDGKKRTDENWAAASTGEPAVKAKAN